MSDERRMGDLLPFLPRLSWDGPLEPFLVFADLLQTHGDPWGTLISVSCRAEPALRVEESRLIAQHGSEIFPLSRSPKVVEVRWARGFVQSISLVKMEVLDDFIAALDTPVLALLKSLWFTKSALTDADARILSAAAPWLARVPHMMVESDTFSAELVAELHKALPTLVRMPPSQGSFDRKEAGPDHRAFLRTHGTYSIDDIDD